MPNITINHAINYTNNAKKKLSIATLPQEFAGKSGGISGLLHVIEHDTSKC